MRKFLLDYNLKVRLPILIFVVLAVFVITYYASFAERNGIGYSPDQPVNFSHKIHAGDMQIDCKYCHSDVDKSSFANVPSTETCMNCHSLARTDKPEIQKLTQYFKEGRPLEWERVHRVPDFVYFNHSSHVNKGIDCANCHGDVQNMDKIAQVSSFTMGACLDCHRNPEQIKDFEKIKNSLNKGPEYCSACHR